MVENPYKSFNASDRSYFAFMKKEIHKLAEQNGFSVRRTGEVDIVVAEMASNLIKHGGGGEILVRMTGEGERQMLELVCIDNGPGMYEPHKMMADGFSSTNTLGHGLGSINRLSDMFQIYSIKDWGTILLSRIGKAEPGKAGKKKIPQVEVRSFLVCKPGEELCGDGASSEFSDEYIRLFLGDGLGHGKEANIAVNEAMNAFERCREEDPVEVIRYVSKAVKKTRGLVASSAIYSMKEKQWAICGVGNIATRIVSTLSSKTYMAYNGIVGLNVPTTMKLQPVPPEPGQMIIMCSDGIRSRWDLAKYPGILKYDLSILAAAVYKDHGRRTDDMSILVCRLNRNL